MNNELRIEFFGDVKFSCGKLNNAIKVDNFADRFGVTLVDGSEVENKHGTIDVKFTSNTLEISAEVENGMVTHINNFEEIDLKSKVLEILAKSDKEELENDLCAIFNVVSARIDDDGMINIETIYGNKWLTDEQMEQVIERWS